jgi:hypothetical protein
MVLVIIDQVICRSLTMGSTARTMRGVCVNPYQIRLLGGRLTLTKRLPSISRRIAARASFTVYDLKRAPRLMVAVVSIVIRNSPL